MNRSHRSIRVAAWLLISGGLTMPLAAQAVAPASQPAGARAAEKPADGPATKPAEPEKPKVNEAFLQSRRASRDNSRNMYANAPDVGDVTLSNLVQVWQERGVLKLEVNPLNIPPGQRFKLKGINAAWTINRSNSSIQTVMGPNGFFRQTVTSASLSRIDLDAKGDDEIWSTTASTNGSYLSVYGQTILGQVTFSQNLSVRPAGFAGNVQPVNLYVYEYGGGPNGVGIRQQITFRGSAKTISELRAKYPEQFRKYLIPLLSKVSDLSWLRPGASDVYTVFTEIPADPQLAERLANLLPELDSDAFHIRDAASAQLLELGAPGVVAALRTNLAELSDEQRAQLGRLIAAHRRRADASAADARRDPAFLADCLEHDDPAVRQAAKAALEKVLGEPVQFDPTLTGDELGAAADALRKKVAALNAPATQPAEADAAKEKQVLPAVAPLIRPRIIINR